MKKEKPIQITEDKAKKARRQARLKLGSVRPASPIVPKHLKPPKHKRPPGENPDE